MQPRPLRLLRSLGRTSEIVLVLLQYGFGDFVERTGLARSVRWGKRVVFWRRSVEAPRRTKAQRIRLVLERLGATFIKFGQVMSTRADLLPADLIQELSQLQENVPPFPSELAVRVLEDELGAPVSELFAEFEREPIAAGSLAQVHRARHFDGTQLAIKVRRPGVEREVERDLMLMLELANLAQRHIREVETFDPVGLVLQFARTIRREMNFAREGRTIEEFGRLFRDDATLRVPKVYQDLTTEAVLTMEFIGGCRTTERESLKWIGIEPKEVAANGARIFMKQAFELGLFHGDPHPGNMRVMADGSICLLDYGMVGTLERETRDHLIDLLLAIARQDVKRTVELVLLVGRPQKPVDHPVLRAEIRDFVETYYNQPLEKVRIGGMLNEFVSILARHRIRCPSDLMILIRALVTLEGVARDLDPGFNLAEQLAPYVEQLVRERYSVPNMGRKLLAELESFASVAHDLPLQIGRILEKLSRDELKVQLEHRGIDRLLNEVDRSSNRIVIGVVVASLIVASGLIIRAGAETNWATMSVFVLSSLLGIWLIYGVFRSGRL